MDPRTWGIPFPLVLLALFVIVMARANATYWLGRAARGGAGRTRMARLLESPGYDKAERLIGRWGAPAVSLCFLTIGVQTMINFVAGASRMSLARYLPAVTVGSIIWALVYGTVGFAGFTALQVLYQRSPVLAVGLGVLLIGFLGGYVMLHVRRRKTGTPGR